MSETSNSQVVARQVERIVRQLTTLSTLPGVVADLLSQFKQDGSSLPAISSKIESDPALTARVLALGKQHGVRFEIMPTVAEAVEQLPLAVLREAVISVSVFETLNSDNDSGDQRQLERGQLALHSLAVACCAEQLAEFVLEPALRHHAYLAGLLHDIGKYALDEVMPKSFDRMVKEAAVEQISLSEVEQQHLGLDHTVLGKRLGQKWGLPEPVVSAIWLHHCDVATLSGMLPEATIAVIAALADRIVKQVGLGHSGSYDTPDDIAELAQLLGITEQALAEVTGALTSVVREKSVQLGLESAADAKQYVSMIRRTAVDLAEDNRRLTESGLTGSRFDKQAELIDTFLDGIDENASPLELAQALAAGWQQYLGGGLCCVYTIGDSTEPFVELAGIDRQKNEIVKTLELPEGIPPVPEIFRTKTSIQPAADAARWLLEQIEAEYDPPRMKMAPLRMADEVVGVVIFEQDAECEPECALVCKVAASAFAMEQAGRKQMELAEKFLRMMGSLRQVRAELSKQASLAGLAEMAAGAAHELNNPLSVISGRAQLLLASETDEEKKQMLEQMQERTEEMSEIVSDLMTFARPPEPKKQDVLISELVAYALKEARQATELSQIEATVSVEGAGRVSVDAIQIGQSLSYIITNALQSYPGDNGPVFIDSSVESESNKVVLSIRDEGCGMDAETLAKATEPFFSHRPAGRRRGMGLAHAQRLLQINGGQLNLTSEPGKGTTLTVTLPKA